VFQNNSGAWISVDPLTRQEEVLEPPDDSSEQKNMFPARTVRFFPKIDSALLMGTHRDDNSRQYILINRTTGEETVIAVFPQGAPEFEFVADVLVSPSGQKIALVERREVHQDGSFRGYEYITHVFDQSGSPLADLASGVRLHALNWSQDESSLAGYSSAPTAYGRDTASVFDLAKSAFVAPHSLFPVVDATYSIGLWNNGGIISGFTSVWPTQSLGFTVQDFVPAETPEQTEPGNPPVERQAFYENIIGLALTRNVELPQSSADGLGFEFASNTRFQDGQVRLSGSGQWDGFLDNTSIRVRGNTGVLVTFMSERGSADIIALVRGEFGKDSYRQFGILQGLNNAGPLISKGTDNGGTLTMLHKDDFRVLPGIWYEVFIGMDGEGKMLQMLWPVEQPDQYWLGTYDYQDETPSFWLSAVNNTGVTYIKAIEIYSLETIKP
jgi:hypothetical protein